MSPLTLPWTRRSEGEREQLEARIHKLERALETAAREAFKDEGPHPIALEYPGAQIVIDAETKLARKRKNAARKEPFTVEWIESLPAGDVLYDIGANVGPYSLIAALRPQGPLRVIAFEPGYANYAALCTNIVLNEAGRHVMALPITLGADSGIGRFRYSDVSAGAALHAGGVDVPVESVFDQQVLVFRLDDLVEDFGLPEPNHIKLDVDGAELSVLQGAASLLASDELQSVMVELSRRDDDAVEEMLVANGLRRQETFWRPAREEGEPAQFAYARYVREADAV